ncbi:HdeD family acid-resistance protein [Sedimentitalea sp. XS_ASV28]|uniref:HdeD family acid-resistance protein n=1 Tax=Sedimentitalea sp. XS_ASV28 TaxID=3241296 RepID=UPI0035177FE4
MTGRNFRLAAGAVALVGGLWGLFNPTAAQFASTTIAGWALLIVGLLQGRAAWQATEARERAGAILFAAAALFIGLSLVFGPFGDGSLLRTILSVLLLVSGAAKFWMGRALQGDPFFPVILVAAGVSAVLGALVLAGTQLTLGFIVSLELLADGAALLVLGLRQGRAQKAG